MNRLFREPGWVKIVLALSLFGWLAQGGWQRAAADGDDHEESPLYESMEAIDGPYRKLRRQIGDASKNTESLKLLATIQKGALAAMGMVPSKAETLPRSERAAFVLAYKRKMLELLGATLDVEAALLKPDNAAAKATYRKLGKLRREGHEAFQIEEE